MFSKDICVKETMIKETQIEDIKAGQYVQIIPEGTVHRVYKVMTTGTVLVNVCGLTRNMLPSQLTVLQDCKHDTHDELSTIRHVYTEQPFADR